MGELGPYSVHLTALNNLDGRTKEARILKSMRRELSNLLGHKPNAGELAMIERIAWLQLRISVLDRRLLDGKFSEFDASVYNAHTNSLARLLVKLGVVGNGKRGSARPGRSLADIIAQHERVA
jgi:hypothetical protein